MVSSRSEDVSKGPHYLLKMLRFQSITCQAMVWVFCAIVVPDRNRHSRLFSHVSHVSSDGSTIFLIVLTSEVRILLTVIFYREIICNKSEENGTLPSFNKKLYLSELSNLHTNSNSNFLRNWILNVENSAYTWIKFKSVGPSHCTEAEKPMRGSTEK